MFLQLRLESSPMCLISFLFFNDLKLNQWYVNILLGNMELKQKCESVEEKEF